MRFALLCLIAFLAHPALAEDAPPAESPWLVHINTGLGTPTGWLGAELGYTLAPGLALSAGIGVGGNGTPQGSTMLRFRTAEVPLGVGGGLSVGGYEFQKAGIMHEGSRFEADLLAFANLELFHDFESDFATLRFTLGFQKVVAGTIECVDEYQEDCSQPINGWPYLGAALVF